MGGIDLSAIFKLVQKIIYMVLVACGINNQKGEYTFLGEYQHPSVAATFSSISLLIVTSFFYYYSLFNLLFIVTHSWEKLFHYLVNVAKIICLLSRALFFS